MPMVGRFVAVLLLTWSMCAAALSGEENFSAQTSKEQWKAQEILVLKMLAGVDADRKAAAFANFQNPLKRKREEDPLILVHSPHPSPPDRKPPNPPCTKFFWKTYAEC